MAFDNQTSDNQTTDNKTTDNKTTENRAAPASAGCCADMSRNDNEYSSRGRSSRQSDMYSIARSIMHGKFAPEAISDAVDVIRGYHGSGLRDETGSIKFEVSDAVRAVLGSGCSTALARLIVATLYPKNYEPAAD